ncbi:nickel-dependent hydrogenase large subunit [Candidatus Chloroploca sp. Khr17]|uniref:nickel-dependent hydrogenase large subunit n=1 Tax=Candidatus Chloroploca sp. Khr17 TaxID=2496869 RepID=UPI00101DA278|nr:nickel-dependent hydrogenase large subunit [Candidatus Chloroploca sp. Khr17]
MKPRHTPETPTPPVGPDTTAQVGQPYKTFLPIVTNGPAEPTPPPATKRLVIDPLTRIEGHLRIEAQIENGVVTDAWSCTMSFRGLELILKGRDPRDAWVFLQRVCGVCTTVHALASLRAVENALGISIPDSARIVRNLLAGSQMVHDHLIHFYHLHGPDWIDVPAALSADPAATAALQRSISPWPNNTSAYFDTVKTRLGGLVGSGQLGLFANGYWGHPAYKLSPEANLLMTAHYLEALTWQQDAVKIHALLGGKNPHPQTYMVGGMAIPLDPNGSTAINNTMVAALRDLMTRVQTFVEQVFLPDVLMVGAAYKDWAGIGAGAGHLLAVGDYPGRDGTLWLPSGVITDRNIGDVANLDQARITEEVARSWYDDSAPLHPSGGVTAPRYTGPTPPFDTLDVSAKYSYGKAPRYGGIPMEVGPLARMLVAYGRSNPTVRSAMDGALGHLGLNPGQLFSALGRIVARAVETKLLAAQLPVWLGELEENMRSGNLSMLDSSRWDPQTWPASAEGFGFTEAPRGALGHWIKIEGGKIANYQAVVPSTWNGSPRDGQGLRGPWEQALVGTPVADPARPVEILRVVHSYDPCMACAVHIVDPKTGETTSIKVR